MLQACSYFITIKNCNMKKYILAAFFVAATTITLVSCDLFTLNKPRHSDNPLIGKWIIDSLSFGKDSSNLSIAYLLLPCP
jgi:hypothetical protein